MLPIKPHNCLIFCTGMEESNQNKSIQSQTYLVSSIRRISILESKSNFTVYLHVSFTGMGE